MALEVPNQGPLTAVLLIATEDYMLEALQFRFEQRVAVLKALLW